MKKAIIFLFFVLGLVQHIYAETDRFYAKRDGLTGTSFHGFLQDSKGFLWIGTNSGLSRFNGYEFNVYEHDENDLTSINSSNVTSISEDKFGRIWVGTVGGLNLYNPQKDNFERIYISFNNIPVYVSVKEIIQDNADFFYLITSHGLIRIHYDSLEQDFFNLKFETNGTPSFTDFNNAVIDPKGNIWIVTIYNGVLIFDTKKEKFLSAEEYTNGIMKIPDKLYYAINITCKGEVLIGPQLGDLLVYDISKKEFYTIPFATETESKLSGGTASIITDKNGTTWVGTEYNGIKILDLDNRKLIDANGQFQVNNIEKSKVLCYEERNGDLWFGVNYQGLYHKTKPFYPFHHLSLTKHKLSHHLVKSILLDSKNNLWVGTDGGDLNIMPDGSDKFQSVNQIVENGAQLNGKVVMNMLEDERGWIWIGTYLDGLYCYKGALNTLVHYPVSMKGTEKKLTSIFKIIESGDGNLWIATSGSGLIYFDVKNGRGIPINELKVEQGREILPDHFTDILLDSDSVLWLASYNGFASWDIKTKSYRNFIYDFPEIRNKTVYQIKEGPGHELLICSNSGLFFYNNSNDSLRMFTTENGLSNNIISAILTDSNNNFWISTSNGLSKFNSESGSFYNYFAYDGLPCDEFMPNSSFKDNHGNFYFGGVNGLVTFHPDSISYKNEKTNLVFTNFKVLNQELKHGCLPNNRKVLDKVINETDTLRLKYSDKSFSFEFAAIDFVTSEKIKYAVKMEGFDETWMIKNSKQRYANYTNLNPGNYIFKVKWTNADGVWNESPREIIIVISPPFWLSWWAFIIYFLLFVIAAYYIRSISLFRISMRNKLHLEQLERQKQESINKAKLQFFTNISHEIRTPLSMLLAPLHQLSETKLNPKQINFIKYVQRNTKRLERLVNQLLELQKIENSQLDLQQHGIDVVAFIGEIVDLFEGTAKEKKVELSFEPSCDKLMVYTDPDKLDKILFNLLSNALKFTAPHGLVTITLDVQKKIEKRDYSLFEITVSDTGIGINQESIDKIFDRFYQVENINPSGREGTGIGLHISKSLVEIQEGTIEVKSTPNVGTTFTICLPLDLNRKINTEDEKIEVLTRKHSSVDLSNYDPDESGQYNKEELNDRDEKSTILVVEDDLDILEFLTNELAFKYKILKASDGDTGWKLARENFPDLILSDVMMPGLNGIEFCNKVKTTFETSHIPFILLTARVAVEHEMIGVETGADDYIHKPFHPSILQLKVEKMIESREILKQKFSKGVSFIAKEMTVNSSDEKFLQKTMDYVKDNLSDSNFSIEGMCSDLSISRVHLYRKLKALTNQSPTEFIRIIRLKQAAYLLSQNKLNISEVAYQVGFNSHQYFTNSFHKYFKMSPKEFVALKLKGQNK